MQYNDFAYIYDELMHSDVPYDKWCDYIENIFSSCGAEPDTICELACGTGSMTSRLEQRGYSLTGVDISQDMLDVAEGKVKAAPLICCDMSRFIPTESYDAFLCMIDGINYVIEPYKLQKTFENVYNALNSGGVFIFDVSTEYKLRNILGNETYIHSDYDIFYSWQNRFTERYNISDMLLNFFVREGEDTYRRFEERHLQRGWTRAQIKKLLSLAGFSDIKVYGELTFDAPQEDCERMVFVCCKK